MKKKARGIRPLISIVTSIAMVSAIAFPNLAYAQGTDSTQAPAAVATPTAQVKTADATAQTAAAATQATAGSTVTQASTDSATAAANSAVASTDSATAAGAATTGNDAAVANTTTDKAAISDTAPAATADTSATASQSSNKDIALTTQTDSAAQFDPTAITDLTPFAYNKGTSITTADIARQVAINESYAAAQGTPAASAGLTTASSTLPSKYDLRDVGGTSYVSGKRQQGILGNCWAHAETAGIESNILKQTGGSDASTINLSERQLSWNTATVVNSGTVIAGRAIDKDQYGEGITVPFGKGTSSSLQGAQALTSWEGLASEYGSQGIPYVNSKGTQEPTVSLWSIPESQRDWAVTHLTDAEVLPSPATIGSQPDAEGNYSYSYNPDGTEAIKHALMENGGVSIAYCANQDQPSDPNTHQTEYNNYLYGSSYVPVMTESKISGKSTVPDHSVCIVGWDDTFSAAHFGTSAKPAGDGAFLCKNSWGSYGQYKKYPVTIAGTVRYVDDLIYSDGTTTMQHVGITGDPNGGYVLYTLDTNQIVKRGLQVYDMSTPDWTLVDADGNKYTASFQPVEGVDSSPTWDGYFWLSYYDATIMYPTSYKTDTPAANASGTYTYTHEYEYDYLGTASALDTKEGAFDTTSTGSASSTGVQAAKTNLIQAANVFTAQANEVLTAVSAVTQTAASTVKIFIYRLLNGATGPTQSATGAPEITMTTTVANAGYHTINLTKPLYLHAGESFSVVEMIKGAGGGYLPIELGSTEPATSTSTHVARIGTGESYISTDGGKTWKDVSTLGTGYFSKDKINDGAAMEAQGVTVNGVGNVMIRAFTNDWTPAPEPTPTPAPSGKAAAATAASYAPTAAGPELPKTGDETLQLAELLVLLMGAGLGTAAYARRRARERA